MTTDTVEREVWVDGWLDAASRLAYTDRAVSLERANEHYQEQNMAGKVTLTLTLKQAHAMSYALQNSTAHEDVMEALFSKPREREAALQAAEKLDQAIRSASK